MIDNLAGIIWWPVVKYPVSTKAQNRPRVFFLKRRVVIFGWWQGLDPKSQKLPLWVCPIEASWKLQTASLSTSHTSGTIESAGSSVTGDSTAYVASWTYRRAFHAGPHSKLSGFGSLGRWSRIAQLSETTKVCCLQNPNRLSRNRASFLVVEGARNLSP